MTIHFPHLDTVDPILDAIKGMPEIGVREDAEHGYGFVMYQVAFEETFASPHETDDPVEKVRRWLLREARGIKYDLETKRIVSRPYHKFFNIGEKLETQPEAVDWSRPHRILEKLDGSMLTPLLNTLLNEIHWMTKRGVTAISATAQEFLADHPNLELFCRDMIAADKTPIFEWCTRKQRIIIDYGAVDRMVLTAVRDNITGEYELYPEMERLALEYGLDLVRALPGSVQNIRKFMAEVRDLEGEEGYIVRFDNGEMYKIKGEWYCRLHKTVDNLRFEKDVIRLILSGDVDDAKPFMVETLRENVERFSHDMRANLLKKAEFLYWEYIALRDNTNNSKKQFASTVMSNEKLVPFQLILFRSFDRDCSQEEIFEQLVALVLKNTTSQTKVNEIRHAFGGIFWKDYLGEVQE